MRKFLLASASLLALTACDLSPDYTLPNFALPSLFKEDTVVAEATVEPATDGKWKRFDEKAKVEEFAWWRMFNDPALDALEEQAMKDNPSLEAAAERVNRARAVADNQDASLFPTLSAGFGPSRQLQSPASIKPNLPPGTAAVTKPYTLYDAKGTISYELDLFGKNRNLSRAAADDAQAEENNYRAARLNLQAEVAQAYYRLAALRMESAIVQKTIATRSDAFALTRKKREVGEVDDLIVASSETDLANVQADAAVLAQNQALQEHALAILVGKLPSELTVGAIALNAKPPVVPAGLPSTLLERRPDIRVAEKQIAAANARIGVARTGYFPDISLSATGGFTSGELSDLFEWSNRTWLIGPLAGTILTQPLFEGGRLAAQLAQSKADYAASVATYRGSVLQAFREVEDQLSGLRNLSDQAAATSTALRSATRANDVAKQRYDVGYASHLEYLDAQRSFLNAQRGQVQVLGNRYVTTIQLVKALGGSWQAAPLPEKLAEPISTPAAAQ
ncbi:MAG: efflux transporter outer membrane subunit [Pseudomonadota bacterium]